MDWSRLSVLGDVILSNANAFAGKPAFIDRGRAVTFEGINQRINRLNNALERLGLAKGDRVAILARNRHEYFEAYGVAKSALIAVPLNWRLSAQELLHPLCDSRPALLLAEPGYASLIDALRSHLPFVRHFVTFGAAREGWLAYEALLAEASDSEPRAEVSPQDVACLMYTSGTTGRPKGAMLTHGALLRNCRQAVENVLELEADDVALAAMPLFHVGGMWYHLFPAFARGCASAILAEFEPRAALRAIEAHGVTVAHFVPTMVHALLMQPEVHAFDLSRLRLLYYAASSIPVELLRRAIGVFRHSRFLQCYGSTEAGMVSALGPEDHARAAREPGRENILLSCGRELGVGEVRIVDLEGRAVPCGEPGEITVRNARSMAGYWDNPVATRQAVTDGWLRTGDIGRIDAEGYLYLVDRKHDMIVSGGENVYPREVEEVLCQDPAVLEAAVFGLPDPKWVERVAAAVVLKPGSAATVDDIVRRARTQLAGYKCPKTVIFADTLPRNATGKVLKRELRRHYGDGAAPVQA